jgi:uncharacterized membrane protein YphA (DoxX/SURF4 family)
VTAVASQVDPWGSVFGRSVDARWVSTGLRIAVGAVFIFSGLTKVADIDGTIRAVRAYQLLPETIVPSVGSGLPVLELALAVLLITGLLIRPAAVITTVLCSAFFIGVASAWARGLQIQCGCFGNGGLTAHPVPGYVRELVLNGLMVAACSWLIRRPASRWSLDSALGLRVDPAEFDSPDDAADSDDSDDTSIGVQR